MFVTYENIFFVETIIDESWGRGLETTQIAYEV
jgi:hypothetical protein